MTLRGMLLALGVLGLFLLIFVPLAIRIMGGTDQRIDADRLRRVYTALSLYEMTHDGLPAPSLALVRSDLEPTDLLSVSDSHAKDQGPFSYDGALPSYPLKSPTRVSWSYRWHWRDAGDPMAVRMDSRNGILASWWAGPVMRVSSDGSLLEKPRSNGSELVFEDLFGKRK